ncbi:MAG: hypothetical protein COA97_07870 [Flavobacteriales bacterium]|nr:MAG: hypothetical protein COA97_07870 [Flavobacteriales bacterium]
MRKFIVLIFIFFISCWAIANKVDSLNNVVKTSGIESEQLDALFQLTNYFKRRDKPKSDSLFAEAEKIFNRLADKTNFYGSYYLAKGNVYFGKAEHKRAMKSFSKAIKHFKSQEDYNGLWATYNTMGSVNDNIGDLTKALTYYLNALDVAKEYLGEGEKVGTFINIGVVYAQQGEFEEALKYFKRSRDYHIQFGAGRGLGNNLNNIGQVYSMMEQRDSSMFYYKEALSVWEETKDKKGMAMTNHNIGSLYKSIKDYNKAEEYLKKSLEICYDMNDQFGITMNISTMSKLFFDIGQKKKGLSYLKEGLAYAKKNGLLTKQIELYNELFKYYKDEGKYKVALENHELFFTVYDSLNNADNKKNLKEIQTKYETEKKQLEIETQRAEIAEKDLNLSESKNKVLLLSFLSIAFVLVIVFVIFSLRQKNKTNKIIAYQKEIVEEKNREITDSITYAKRIQNAILPTKKLVKEWLPNSFIFYRPKDIVAGDFYWMDQRDGYILFAAADCTGHGVPGAMVSVVCHNAMNRVIRDFNLLDPGKILDKTREIIVEQFDKSEDSEVASMQNIRDGMDIALCVLNTKTNELKYAGAYNPLWIIRIGADEIEEIKANKQSIGKVENPQAYDTQHVQLNKGDSIYIFSDGFADQFGGEKGKKLKNRPFKKLLISMKDETMENQLKTIGNHFEIWKGELEQVDDVCIIGVRI